MVRRLTPLVWTICRRTCDEEEEAADAYQGTLVGVWRNLRHLRDPERLVPWVSQIARHEAGARNRRRWKEQGWLRRLEAHQRASVQEPDDDLERVEAAHILRGAVRSLPEPHRKVVEALFLGPEEKTYDEIASDLSMPRGSLGPIRARALELLRSELILSGHRFFVSRRPQDNSSLQAKQAPPNTDTPTDGPDHETR